MAPVFLGAAAAVVGLGISSAITGSHPSAGQFFSTIGLGGLGGVAGGGIMGGVEGGLASATGPSAMEFASPFMTPAGVAPLSTAAAIPAAAAATGSIWDKLLSPQVLTPAITTAGQVASLAMQPDYPDITPSPPIPPQTMALTETDPLEQKRYEASPEAIDLANQRRIAREREFAQARAQEERNAIVALLGTRGAYGAPTSDEYLWASRSAQQRLIGIPPVFGAARHGTV
uniref:Uncharacterized protein n=1 Tax=viral metagenome TaxID=1070528 RepID=A0A6M3IID0_9ZZZZ